MFLNHHICAVDVIDVYFEMKTTSKNEQSSNGMRGSFSNTVVYVIISASVFILTFPNQML